MSFIRSLLFALVFYSGSVLAVLFAFPVALTGPRPFRKWVRGWAWFHRLCARFILGIRTRVEGPVPAGPALIAYKHQSMFETIECLLLVKDPAVVLKRELADLPGWGRIARMHGVIPVDREGGASALRRMLRAAEAAVSDGRPIVIFPEGTRVSVGDTPPLQSGFAGLYKALKLPVVAVALDSGRVWPRGRFVKRPGIVTMRFHDPIPPGLPRGEVEAEVHRRINALEHA